MDLKKYKIILPNMVTSLTILCGIFAIFLCVDQDRAGGVELACWLVIFAAMIDGLDGKVARLTKTSSEFGIQFDSIADVLTFGAATAVILYGGFFTQFIDKGPIGRNHLFYIFPVIFLLCGAIRLARFNVTASTKGKTHFVGMPIPTAAGAMVTMVLTFDWFEEHGILIPRGIVLRAAIFYTLLISLMMISTVHCQRPFGFFFSDIRRHWFRSTVNAVLFVVLCVYPSLALFAVCVFYVFYSIAREFGGAAVAEKEEAPSVQFE